MDDRQRDWNQRYFAELVRVLLAFHAANERDGYEGPFVIEGYYDEGTVAKPHFKLNNKLHRVKK